MRILIFHYHLNPGGVTRIIESQVAGFRKEYPDADIQVAAGYCENEEFYASMGVKLTIDPIYNYLFDRDFEQGELKDIYDQIYSKVKSMICEGTILHIHNINLGKNPVLTLVFNTLLNEGYSLVNHAHDFSEDRPVNQAYMGKVINDEFGKEVSDVMYPESDNYLVGVLNRFDYDRVLKLGIDESRAFLFPNPVYVPVEKTPNKEANRIKIADLFGIESSKTIVTYPVRVIRRKNIGELILFASLYENMQVLVTLPPRNPVEVEIYEKWKTFCTNNNIPIMFEAGEKAFFIEIISGSDYCITTSVQEGFGMAYLEPWLIGTPVIGRDIEYVTRDLKSEGVDFPFLYQKLIVSSNGEKKEFSILDIEEQQSVIKNVISGSLNLEEFKSDNESFESFPPKVTAEQIEKNQQTIINNFSVEEYARRIFKAYQVLPE